MQPENSHGNMPGVEQYAAPPNMGPESAPNLPPLDSSIERGQERFEQAGENRAPIAVNAPVMQPQVPVAPAVYAPVEQAAAPELASGAPIVAADEDLIEKAWVDKAKDIISQTHGDPRTRTERVIELRTDYQTKRTASAGNPPIGSQ